MAALGGLSAGALGQSYTLQNDSLVNGSEAFICPCFAGGEEAAVWLDIPCDGNITGIQIFWKSQFGGAQPALEEAILVYEGATYPRPGALIEELVAPQLLDGGLNFYEFYDENQTLPIEIQVFGGETIVVSLQFFNTNAGDVFAPSLISDADGVTPGRNAVKTESGQWFSNEDLGVSGDWVIRAVVECDTPPTGACCLPNGMCDQLTEEECALMSGLWNGIATDCADAECLGACYIDSTQQCLQFDKATCDAVAGFWSGPGTTACPDPCAADLNGDGISDSGDIGIFVQAFLAGSLTVDFNADGLLDNSDIAAFIDVFLLGC